MEKLKNNRTVSFKVVYDIGHCKGHFGEIFTVRKSSLGIWGCGIKQQLKHKCCYPCLGYIQLPWVYLTKSTSNGVCVGVGNPDVWCLRVVEDGET